MLDLMDSDIKDAILHFNIEGSFIDYHEYGNGHINDSYCVIVEDHNKNTIKYILQRINVYVFKHPTEVMENMARVTDHIKEKIKLANGDVNRETLSFIRAIDNKPYYWSNSGNFFRMCRFIDNTICYDIASSELDFYEAAKAFGRFQANLVDFPINSLYETIKDFHNTAKRFVRFKEVVEADAYNRKATVLEEIDFYLRYEALSYVFDDLMSKGLVPLRVTHNDTKLNNVLIDKVTHKGLCVIDLDTVMPGLAMNDFGDAIRTGASTGLEDEVDLSKVSFDLNLYEAFLKGFIEETNGVLSETELKYLPLGALVMTYECGMRFLTDYLENDIYFSISRENHNLDRCRTQIKLLSDMINNYDNMNFILNKYLK